MSDSPSSANRQIARATGTVMLALLVSQLASLAYSILAASAFDATTELDPFLAANRPAETLFVLIAGGALGSAFIPTFTALLVKGDRRSAWRLASAIGNLLILISSALAALAAIFAPQVVRVALAPAFAADPVKFALTVDLLRIQMISAVLFGLGGLLVGILNSHQVFLFSALAPALYRLGLIFGILVLAPSMGIYGLAWGVVIGAALYLLIQVPALLRQKGSYSPTLGIGDPAVGEVFRLMGPRLLGVAVVQLNFWVNTWLGSRWEGAVTGLSIGYTMFLMAQAVIAQSAATAAMPTFAAQYAMGKLDEIRSGLAATLRSVLLLAVPASLGLILLRRPIVTLIYQRGAFTAETAELVSWALLWYAAGLIGHSVYEILARTFYALHDTRTPVLVGVAAMSLNVGLSFGFSALFERVGWLPHGGLALANSLATALEALTLILLIRRRLNGIEGSHVTRGLGAAALGTLGMAAGLWAWLQVRGSGSTAVTTLGGVALGGAVYGLILVLLRVQEVKNLFHAARRRLHR
ncbi:MAG: murein biosynthesis integral membrane protein MurJ [Anaerolineales bacterium]|nr:murein biosynthesis integral membrane protein MurJ [Anaerolineales bacterium]